jgi:hypothetical protein
VRKEACVAITGAIEPSSFSSSFSIGLGSFGILANGGGEKVGEGERGEREELDERERERLRFGVGDLRLGETGVTSASIVEPADGAVRIVFETSACLFFTEDNCFWIFSVFLAKMAANSSSD